MAEERHGLPRWPFVAMLILGGAAAAYLAAMMLTSHTRSGGGREGTGETRKILAGHSVARLSDRRTRLEEVRRLGREGVPEAVPMLRKFADAEDDPELRLACVEALGRIGDPEGIQAVRVRCFDTDPRVRIAAAEALGRMYSERADGGLKDLLADTDIGVRLAAVEALASVLPDERARTRLGDALDDEAASVRQAAVDALAEAGQRSSEELIEGILDSEPSVRARAAAALEKVGKEALPALREALSPRVKLDVRKDVARLLGRIGGTETVPALLQTLEDLRRPREEEAAELEALVVESLRAMGPAVVEPLVAEVVAREYGSRAERTGARVLADMGRPAAEAIAQGILAWKLFPDPQELKLWVGVLGEIGDPAAQEALNRALAQDVEGMATLVAEARAKIEAASGSSLPPAAPHEGLLAEPPGPAAYRTLYSAPATLTPLDPEGGTIPDDGVVRVLLKGAIPREGGRQDLEIELMRRGGAWVDECYGYALRLNKRSHVGRLRAHTGGPKPTLEIEIFILDDVWVKGGYGVYTVAMEASPKGLAGSYEGHFNFREVSGALAGAAWPHAWTEPTIAPAAPEEHPRMLFRPKDLDVLRERVRTPFGRRILRALRARVARHKRLHQEPVNWVTTWEPGIDAAVGYGFLATLFEEPGYGRRAAELVLQRTETPPYGGEHGERVPGPLFHYPFACDLTWAFLDETERQAVSHATRKVYLRCSVENGPTGIFAVSRGVFPVPGMLCLLVLGEKGPFEMEPPPAPPPTETIPPLAEAPPRQGVPVNRFEAGSIVRDWLLAGPFDADAADPLAPLGGPAEATPVKGTPVPYRTTELRFVPLPEESYREIGSLGGKGRYLLIPGADAATRTFLYALLEVKRTQDFCVDCSSPIGARWERVWIDGRPLEHGTMVILEPGLHRIMIEAVGPGFMPVFTVADAHYAKALGVRHEWRLAQIEAARKRHQATGRRQNIRIILDMLRRGTRSAAMRQMRDAAAGRDVKLGEWALPFAGSCRTALGEAFVPDTPVVLAARPEMLDSPRMHRRYLCFAMGMVPEDMRAAVAREFDRRFPPGKLDELQCIELVAALVHYPLESGETKARGGQ